MLLFLVVGPAHGGKVRQRSPFCRPLSSPLLCRGCCSASCSPGWRCWGRRASCSCSSCWPPCQAAPGASPVTMLLVAALYLGDQIYAILFVQDNVANFMHIVGGGVRHRLRLLQRLCPAPPPQALRPAKVTLLFQGPAIQKRLAENPAAFHSQNRQFCLLFFGHPAGIMHT